jgi:ferrous iron transport protein A
MCKVRQRYDGTDGFMNKRISEIDTATSLASVAPGDSAQVSRIEGGRAVTQRLAMLGIRPGVVVNLLHGPGRRGAVLRVGGARVALGRGVIERITVVPYSRSKVSEAAAE